MTKTQKTVYLSKENDKYIKDNYISLTLLVNSEIDKMRRVENK